MSYDSHSGAKLDGRQPIAYVVELEPLMVGAGPVAERIESAIERARSEFMQDVRLVQVLVPGWYAIFETIE